jgi:PAS domain S-box-containing protein
VKRVLDELHQTSREVASRDGRWYIAQVSPYRSTENDIEGVILTFIDITKRKHAEASLLEAKERMALLVESAKGHAIYTMDADGRIDYWNIGARTLFGYAESEIIGNSTALLLTPEDREHQVMKREMREANERGSVSDERWYVRKDGTRFYASGFLSLLRDERVKSGAVHGYAMITRDLTERKIAADESIRFQARLLDAVEQSVIATNPDGIVIYWNQFAQKLYGWTAQEAIGRQIMELTMPEIMSKQALEIMSQLRQGKSWFGEFNVQRRDGTTFPAQIINSPIHDSEGNLIGIVGVSIDITERKRQEDSLIKLTRQFERQSNVFNTTLSSITDFAYIFDRDGRFIYANQPLLDLWGLKLEEAMGKNFFDLQYPEHLASRLQQQIQQVIDTRQGIRDETPYTSPSGAQGFYEYIFTPVFAADGTVEVVAGSTRDYTERKRAEEVIRSSEAKLQKSHEELERRVAERTATLSEMNAVLQEEVRERQRIEGERVELLRRIVFAQEDERRRIAREMHDQFGQQLTALKLKLDAVKEDCGKQENLCEQVEALQTIAMQLDADVDHMVWEMRPTALDDLGLKSALSTYVQNWSKHVGIHVQLHASGMDRERLTPEIETALYRIAQEALNNVAKHAEAASVAVVLERRVGQVSLIIEDDGRGFDLQQILKADDKGLGLIGMRERAALVGGTVEIESQSGDGATVAVRIPTPPAPETGEADE